MDLGGTPSGNYIIIIQCPGLPIGFRNNVTFLILDCCLPLHSLQTTDALSFTQFLLFPVVGEGESHQQSPVVMLCAVISTHGRVILQTTLVCAYVFPEHSEVLDGLVKT